ncbi:MAG TPA: DUF4129 domain-containing protein [Haliangiales bacterium]|nr:DUF4129 domain-containing protein [Haliangiales bacterium]
MSRKHPKLAGEGVLELIEEALHLLRLSPWRVLASYYVGCLPFVLGFLYFWTDMSRSSSAYDHCAPAALRVALLFLWMKTWQAIFARGLKTQITGRPAPALTFSRFVRAGLVQIVIQPSGLFVLPMALLVALPFGWAYAFYQSVTAFGAEEGADIRGVFKRARQQMQLWPKQNHVLLAVFFLLGLITFLDLTIGLFYVPELLKTFFGIESAFTRGGWSFFNTTFLTVVCALTYLCLDPLVKAVYLLRCYYGESLHTGEDLKAELKPLVPGARAAAAILLLLIFLPGAPPLNAATASENPKSEIRNPKSGIAPEDLDRAIEQVINRREFNWRLPREKRVEDQSEKGVFASFVEGVLDTIRSWARAVGRAARAVVRWIADALDWLREKILGQRAVANERGSGSTDWMVFMQALIFVLLLLAACAVAILFYRIWKHRGARPDVAGEAVAPVPDLADENVVADQLPEDDWLRLARELMGRGEPRLALRALYLASLAHLAQREMIRVAKFKSNRDYEQELRRRARALPVLQAAFAENVGIFDRVWYGLHDVSEEALEHFQVNLEKIKAC